MISGDTNTNTNDTNDMRRRSYRCGESYKLDAREDSDNPRCFPPKGDKGFVLASKKARGRAKFGNTPTNEKEQTKASP